MPRQSFGRREGDLLIGRGSFDVIDDDDIDRRLGRDELQAKLLLKRGEDRRPGVGRLRHPIRSPFEGEVVFAAQAGLVDNEATYRP